MRQFALRINGVQVEEKAEPRVHLADFLREQRYLTGTHIGCEHGVCGACTVLIDGAPARSCITYAVACEGAEITTIEGLRNDPIMVDLREAFSAIMPCNADIVRQECLSVAVTSSCGFQKPMRHASALNCREIFVAARVTSG